MSASRSRSKSNSSSGGSSVERSSRGSSVGSRSSSSGHSASGERNRSRSPHRKHDHVATKSATTIIRVDKLTRNVTKEHMNEIFSAYGPLKNIEMISGSGPLPHAAPMELTSATIEFEKHTDATKAVKYMNGGMIDKQEIIVSSIEKLITNRR